MSNFSTIYKKNRNLVHECCYRFEKDHSLLKDLEQDVWLRIATNLEKFSPDGPAALSTWIWEITENMCIDYLRRQESRIECVSEQEISYSLGLEEDSYWTDPHVQDIETPEDYVSAEQSALSEEELIENLTTRQYFIYASVYQDGAKTSDVAEFLGTSNSYIYKELHLIRAKLEEILQAR